MLQPRGNVRESLGFLRGTKRFDDALQLRDGDNRFRYFSMYPNFAKHIVDMNLHYNIGIQQGTGIIDAFQTAKNVAGALSKLKEGFTNPTATNIKNQIMEKGQMIGLVNKESKPLYDGEAHLIGINNRKVDFYNFCGPYTQLDKRLERNDKPINEIDKQCQYHDMEYASSRTAQDIREADKKFITGIDTVKGYPKTKKLLKAAIKGKNLVEDLGIAQPSNFSDVKIGNGSNFYPPQLSIVKEKIKMPPAVRLKKKLMDRIKVMKI